MIPGFLLIVCTYIFSKFRDRSAPIIDPYTVFFLSLIYYGFYIPILMQITRYPSVPFLDGNLWVSTYEQAIISTVLAAGFLAFSIGYKMLPKFLLRDTANLEIATEVNQEHQKSNVDFRSLSTILVISCAAVIFSVYRENLSMITQSYEMKIEGKYEASTFSLLIMMFYALCGVWFNHRILTAKPLIWGLAGISVFVFLSFATYSKDPLVFGGISGMCLGYRMARSQQMKTILLVAVGMMLALLFLIPVFSAYRATGRIDFVDPLHSNVSLLFSDARGPYATLVLAAGRQIYVTLNPLWESVILWIPRAIWAERPLDAAEAFARAVMPDWKPGFGVGFSPFAEGVVRFGVVLSPLLLLTLGVCMALLERLFLRFTMPAGRAAVLITMQGYVAFTLHRSPFSALFTTMLQLWMPFLVLSLAATVFLAAGKRGRR